MNIYIYFLLLGVTGSDQPFGLQSLPNHLITTTPNSLNHDGGAGFYQHARKVCKKWQELKLLVERVNRYKNMSYSQINSLIKAVQDEKLTKMIKKRTACY
jgi:hypothetical protein